MATKLDGLWTVSDLRELVGYPETTTRRHLEDLEAHNAVEQSSRSEDEKPEKRDGVGEATSQHGAGNQMQERQEDDLMVVRCASARGKTNDLERSGKFHNDRDGITAKRNARDLHRKDQERSNHASQLDRSLLAVALRQKQAEDQPEEHNSCGDGVKFATGD
jgi:hypothetical protein